VVPCLKRLWVRRDKVERHLSVGIIVGMRLLQGAFIMNRVAEDNIILNIILAHADARSLGLVAERFQVDSILLDINNISRDRDLFARAFVRDMPVRVVSLEAEDVRRGRGPRGSHVPYIPDCIRGDNNLDKRALPHAF